MEKIIIRRFVENDAEELSEIIQRNLMEINIRDYPFDSMQKAANVFTKEKVLSLGKLTHTYTVTLNNKVLGCGSIAPYLAKLDESMLLTIFVHPEYHNQGIGRKIIETLEKDDYFTRAKRIEIPSSITACKFYMKFGYNYKNGEILDSDGHYILEKFK